MKNYFFILLFSLCAFTSFAQINLSQGQVLHFTFNGNANDVSGNNNHGVVNGPTLTTDKWGNANGAYQFDGIDDFINVPSTASLAISANQFSLYALVKVKGFYQGTCHGNFIISKGSSETTPGVMQLAYVDGYKTNWTHCNNTIVDTQQNFYTSTPGGTISTNITPAYLIPEEWHCVIGVVDGDTIRTYMDNVLCFESIRPGGSSASSSEDFFIGKLNNSLYPFFINAIVDEVRIYDRSLNAEERLALCEYVNTPNSVTNLNKITNQVSIFPNPTSGFINIKVLENSYNTIVNLVDLNGKIIRSEQTDLSQTTNFQFDISNISKGAYFLKLNGETISESHKVIIE